MPSFKVFAKKQTTETAQSTAGNFSNATYNPNRATEATKPQEKEKKLYFLSLSIQDQILFAKRLALLIKAGVPILGALSMLKKQASTKNTAYIFTSLHAQVENGSYLSSSMVKFKKIFGEFAVNIIRVGEVSGTLQQNLAYLSEELKKKQELRRKVISALVYPIFIVIATIGVAILLTAYVFPKLMPLFKTFKFELPWTTKVLIGTSNILMHYGLFILLGIAFLIAAFVFLLSNYKVKLWVHRKILFIPLLGPLFQSYNIANFTRTLALLLKSDVRIVEALNIVASTTSNAAYQKEFSLIATSLTKGEKLSNYMEKDKKLFPVIMSQMVAVGEATGGLSNTLLFLSEMYEDDLNNATKNLSTSLEPILMIFMGFLVGFIALSIITPIYGVTQNIHP